MIRKSTAEWQGDGLHGKGTLATQSGVFKSQPYSFQTRFQNEDGKAGTNPEELLAAAHAGCFAMALSFALTEAGHAPEELRVTAAVDIQKAEGGFAIKTINLDLEARVGGMDAATFEKIAEGAKKGCPISRALSATPITLSARLLDRGHSPMPLQ
ncbi:MAG TPA: OsmC family protein [Polyangiaceae bacterium]|nr:OsmC family protein [Polyangiaceae bacterium]